MQNSNMPLVSIGIPVFNGENYLHHAIQSILAQTYSNFELIISDNASTDNTQAICNEYVRSDHRIKYIRNDVNHGAGPNYDNCFHNSTGKYFKWTAHDDMVDRRFIQYAVEKLEKNPDSMLCFSDVKIIDKNNATIRIYSLEHNDVFSEIPSERFRSMVVDMTGCEYFFGLMRKTALMNSELHGNYINSDKVLIAEIALLGKFSKVDDTFIILRKHDHQYSSSVYPDREKAAVWFDINNKNITPLRRITLYKKYCKVVRKNINNRRERMLCYKHLLYYAFKRRNLRILLHDLILLISPRLYYHFSFFYGKDRLMR